VQGDPPRRLDYSPAPVDNPLKELVPYQGDRRGAFPHSLEFNYLPYSALVKDYDEFDWKPLERMLDDIAGRGHQAVLRVYLEYPGRKGAIPGFLLRDGLTVHKTADGETPDYENANLRRSLRAFIAAFGEKYDGDPRIGFLTAGLLGALGEWHTFPRSGDAPRVWKDTLDVTGVNPGSWRLALRVPNPLKAGRTLQFANRAQDADAPGWLSLGVLEIP
jgi:hypothetical protein